MPPGSSNCIPPATGVGAIRWTACGGTDGSFTPAFGSATQSNLYTAVLLFSDSGTGGFILGDDEAAQAEDSMVSTTLPLASRLKILERPTKN